MMAFHFGLGFIVVAVKEPEWDTRLKLVALKMRKKSREI
jgi:hypothetical protein